MSLEIGQPLLTLNYRVELEEFLTTVKGYEAANVKITRWGFSIAAAAITALLFVLPYVMTQVPGPVVAGLLFALPFAITLGIWPWLDRPTRVWRQQYFRCPPEAQQVEVCEGGVRFITEHQETTILWTGFHGYKESGSQIVLRSGFLGYIFPKRALNEDELGIFREQVRRHLRAER